jgi:hypothetical protein
MKNFLGHRRSSVRAMCYAVVAALMAAMVSSVARAEQSGRARRAV